MKWFPDWRNDIAAVVASGPSAKDARLDLLKDRVRVIAVNSSWRLVPFADVVYACDPEWWATYGDDVRRSSRALRVAVAKRNHQYPDDMNLVLVPPPHKRAERAWMLMQPRGIIGTGGNSGFQAINLAAQFGARKILMVGFDMRLDNGTHWHGDHTNGLRNPSSDLMAKWRKMLDAQANTLREYGIDVVNCSPVSALTEFRFASIEEALEQWTALA